MENETHVVNSAPEFESALAALPHGGNILLTGKIEIKNTVVPPHGGRLTLTARDGGALVFAAGGLLTLGGETAFENITLDVPADGYIAAAFHPLIFGSGVNVLSDFSVEKNGLYLVGGDYAAENTKDVYEESTSIRVSSGKISRIFGFSLGCDGRVHTGKAEINVGGDAYVRYVVAGAAGENTTAGSAALTLSERAVIETLMVGGSRPGNLLDGDFSMYVLGGDIFCFHYLSLSNAKGRRSLLYVPAAAPDGLVFLAELAKFDSIQSVCDIEGHTFGEPFENPFDRSRKICRCTRCGSVKTDNDTPVKRERGVLFAADGGFGDGSAPDLPLGSFDAALRALGDAGGRIVLVGRCTLTPNLIDRFGKMADACQPPRHSGKITVTCVHAGVDYRARGAALFFPQNTDLRMSGPMEFEHIAFDAADGTDAHKIVARYSPLHIGKDVRTPDRKGCAFDIIGGYLGFRYSDLDGLTVTDEWEDVVNSVRPLPADFHFDDLEPVEEGSPYLLRHTAAVAFRKMFADMQALGMKKPYISDGYRTYARQYQHFTNSVWRLRRTYGYGFEKAKRVVLQSCGLPLWSEHHRGVAVDMYDNDLVQFGGKRHHYYFLTREWGWVCENGHKYGIILRYPQNKTDISGIIYEPWHFSYVGVDAATILRATGLSIEEYLGAKYGCFHKDARVTVESGRYRRITASSVGTDMQLTGAHHLTIADAVEYDA